MVVSFEACKPGYTKLWTSMVVNPQHVAEVSAVAQLIVRGKPRYLTVARETTVPWFVIGILHYMEANCRFDRWLHNGDRMFAPNGTPIRTVQVPQARPPDPRVSWEEGAKDALALNHLDKVGNWSVERVAFMAETFNGWGYRAHEVNSPYLWSMTNQYTHGFYVADHQFSPTAVSKECGAMAILATLIELDASVGVELSGAMPKPLPIPAPPDVPPVPRGPPAPPSWIAAILQFIARLLGH